MELGSALARHLQGAPENQHPSKERHHAMLCLSHSYNGQHEFSEEITDPFVLPVLSRADTAATHHTILWLRLLNLGNSHSSSYGLTKVSEEVDNNLSH